MIEPGEDRRRILLAIAAGRVRLGSIPHTNGRYLLAGIEPVDTVLLELKNADLVHVPEYGNAKPKLTPDGEWALTNFT
jgi:hypothetical protein